jgi:hypothetical protein
MGALELVFVIGGAWCALLGFVVALMAVASRAEERFEAPVVKVRRLPVRRPPAPRARVR